MTANGRHRADPLDLSETRRRLDDLITFAAEVHDAATATRDAMDANEPFIIPEPIDLSARLAPYHTATEDVPRDVVCAVLDALAMCDLSLVKPALGDLRTALTVRDDYPWIGDDNDPRTRELNTDVWEVHSRLLWQLRADGAWPQQSARTREPIYRGRAE